MVRKALFAGPFWLWPFRLTAFSFILQVLPISAGFAFILAAPLWPIGLLNLGFALIVFETLLRKSNPYYLLGPLLWFGGYFVLAMLSHQNLDLLEADITRQNHGQVIAFNQTETNLLVDVPNISLEALARWYVINDVYVPSRSSCGPFQSYHVDVGSCTTARPLVRPSSKTCPAFQSEVALKEAQRLCLTANWNTPPVARTIRVTVVRQQISSIWYSGELDVISLTSSDGPSVSVRAGRLAPLTWFPQPIVGCGPISGSWQCIATWRRGATRQLASPANRQSSTTAIARALDLMER